MTITNDSDEYIEQWDDYINQLSSIKIALSDPDDLERINDLQDELKDLVRVAAGESNDEQT